jgi:hypothetical protein
LRRALLGLTLVLGMAGPCFGSTFGVDGLTLKAGVGYEFLSQDFYLDSLEQAGIDSLDLTTTLKTTYFDDLKAQLRFGYASGENRRFSLDGVYEQTSDQQRLRAYLYQAFSAGPFRIDWSGEADFREGKIDPTEGDPGYVSGNARARISLPVARNTTLWTRFRGDRVQFDSAGQGAFDYNRAGVELGVTQYLGGYSILTGSGFVLNRYVPEARTEEYHSAGFDLSLAGVVAEGDFDVSIRYESRDYARGGDLDDYRRWELNLRDYRPLGGSFFTREELEIEILAFDSTAYLTSDYQRVELAVLAGLERSWGSLAAGPHFATLSETQVDAYTVGEDYVEYGIKTQVDLIRPGRALVSLESISGRRNLKDEGTDELVQTDFDFERLNLLVDWTAVGRIGVSLLLSTEWEWHREASENSRMALVTSGVTYSF